MWGPVSGRGQGERGQDWSRDYRRDTSQDVVAAVHVATRMNLFFIFMKRETLVEARITGSFLMRVSEM